MPGSNKPIESNDPELIKLEQDDILIPENGDSESGKFKQLLGILKKVIGVSDLANIRLSLPANLLEPVGNLEYWNYCERPDFFASINGPDNDLERMLAVVRWTFTKDLRFVKGRLLKPYNSILGEHFHCYYETSPLAFDSDGVPIITQWKDNDPGSTAASDAGSIRASASVSTATLAPQVTEDHDTSTDTRVAYLTEQTSHHPPISHFVLEARGPKGIVIATGADQLSAKFTGTSIKVVPGSHTNGIFITLPDRNNEEYQVTHPTATVAGLLRASPYAAMGDCTHITVRNGTGRKLRAIIQYIDESWLGKAKFLIEGVIYEYEEGDEDAWTKVKQVPTEKVLVQLSGSWRGEIKYKTPASKNWMTLLDLQKLLQAPKHVALLENQDELETRKVWKDVTHALQTKNWNEAHNAKTSLEQRQRVFAEERKQSGTVYSPKYFVQEGEDWDGRPTMTSAGKEALERCFTAQYPVSGGNS